MFKFGLIFIFLIIGLVFVFGTLLAGSFFVRDEPYV
jgi:hypothetical protein